MIPNNEQTNNQELNPEVEALTHLSIETNNKLNELNDKTEAGIYQQTQTHEAIKELLPALEGILLNTEPQEVPETFSLNIKGYTPKKGKDYFTKDEIKQFKEDITPEKGKDYYTEKEIKSIKKEITPIKGKDYFTESDIKVIRDSLKQEVTPIKGKDYFDGKDYSLTEQDKKDIALNIEVPIIEKQILTVEKPIIKEVAKYETTDEIIKKLNTTNKQIDFKTIKNFPDFHIGAGYLRELSDVNVGKVDITDGYVLAWDASNKYWKAVEQSGGGGSGTVTSIDVSGGSTGLTFSGGPITTSGTITMSGVLDIDNGGTNNTSFTDTGIVWYNSGDDRLETSPLFIRNEGGSYVGLYLDSGFGNDYRVYDFKNGPSSAVNLSIGANTPSPDTVIGITGNLFINPSVTASTIVDADDTGGENTVVGLSAMSSGTPASFFGNTLLGYNTYADGNFNAVFGNLAQATGSNNFVMATLSNVTGDSNILLGSQLTVTANNSIIINPGLQVEASYLDNTMVVGAGYNFGEITDAYFGTGRQSNGYGGDNTTSLTDFNLRASGAVAEGSGVDDIIGTNLNFYGGQASGNAQGGEFGWYTSDAGSSGDTLQSFTRKMALSTTGELTLDSYGVGTYTGTPTYSISTTATGELIETPVSGGGQGIYMFTEDASDISGYYQAVEASLYTIGTLSTASQTVTTSETLLEEFATNSGYPNTTIIPTGIITVHCDTQKTSGTNNYYIYAKIYTRTTGGTETLVETTDYSSQSVSNAILQQSVSTVITTPITLLATDRIVVKVYARMVSGSATITLRWDDATYSRVEFPTASSIAGVTGTGTINELAYWTSSLSLGSLSTATYPSLTELSYVKGVTSSIQTQLNGKQATLTLPLSPAQGGTGIANNASSTITISGAFGTTFTVSGTTNVTLPTSGTLLAGSLTNTRIPYYNGTALTDSGNLVWDNANSQLQVLNSGSAAAPSIAVGTFSNGLFLPSPNTIGFATNGIQRFQVDGTSLNSITTGGAFMKRAAGAAATPTFAFNGTTDTGMWLDSNALGFAVDGVNYLGINSNAAFADIMTLTAGTLTADKRALYITATQPATPTLAQNAIMFSITSNGSASFVNRGLLVDYLAGYTGSSNSNAGAFVNRVAGTGGTMSSASGNVGSSGNALATTTGYNYGLVGLASNGNVNIGNLNVVTTAKNSAANIGVAAFALNTGTSPTQIGGFFGLMNSEPTLTSAALMADNGSQTADIFVARDNGTAVFTIVDGGDVTGTASIKSSSATAGIGYATGAGGTVTQATSRTTGVTLNKITGAITLVSAAGSATPASFTVTNSAVGATDTIIVNQKSGTDKYIISVTAVGAGSFEITSYTTGGTTTEQPVFNFAVIKGVAS